MEPAESLEFRRYLACHRSLEGAFRVLVESESALVDCRNCSACCRETVVEVSPQDVLRIAEWLGMPAADVERLYTAPDPADGRVRNLRTSAGACVFLHRGLCLVYDARPAACRDFPYRRGWLGSRWASVSRHAEICPILRTALERLERLTGFRRRYGERH